MTRRLLPVFLAVIVTFREFETVRAAVDRTRESKATGAEVVEAVIRKIRRSQIFKDDYDFLKRSALLETNFGEDPNTFIDPESKGIWKVTEAMLNITKSDKLKPLHELIMTKFDIDWSRVRLSNMDKPLHNGLAFRLYLHSVAPNLPQTAEKQESLWKYVYQKTGPVSGQFTDKVANFDDKAAKCRGLFDLTIVMDGSGSIGEEDFEKSKDFVINLFATYSSDSVRKAFILFGDEAYMIFPLDNKLKVEEQQKRVKEVTYPSEATNTDAGILMAVEMIKNVTRRQEGVPSILIVFTDGESNVGDGVSNARLARASNITTFAVGIGARLNQSELLEIAYNNPSHVLLTNDYTTLKSLVNRINAETCLVSQKPAVGEETSDFLFTDEYRYYEYPVTGRGIVVTVNNTDGKIEGYYSFTDENPSEAVHDGILNNTVTVIDPPDDFWDRFTSSELDGDVEPSTQIFITLQGKKKDNNYTIEVNPASRPVKPRRRLNGTGSATGSLTALGNGANDSSSSGNGTDGTSGSGNGTPGTNGTGGNGSGTTGTNGTGGNGSGAAGTNGTGGNGSGTNGYDGANGSNEIGSNGYGSNGKGGPNGNSGSGPNNSKESDSDSPGSAGSSSRPGFQGQWGDSDEYDSPNSRRPGNEERRRRPTKPTGEPSYTLGGLPSASASGNNGKLPPCPERYIGFVPFPDRCDLYTLCTFGVRVLLECAPGLHFDRALSTCNFIQLANCAGSSYTIPNLTRPDRTTAE